ncbi:MAG: PQQ-binding-like beta-propeller repeat protein, partial [Pseudomonadota bacterium]
MNMVSVRGLTGRSIAGLLAVVVLATGCSYFDDEERLEGERIRIRDQQRPGQTFTGNVPALPEARRNAEWTQTNGTANHAAGHLEGPINLVSAWRADAGSGSEDGITGTPVITGGRVYVLDAAAQLSAFDASSGSVAWR